MEHPRATAGPQSIVRPGEAAGLTARDPGWSGGSEFPELAAEAVEQRAKDAIAQGSAELSDAQELLWASDRYALLVVLQAMDAAGKDSVIKHVMSGVNPQGVQVVSFRKPSSEELDHDFLWRISRALPERGRIGIFNRLALRGGRRAQGPPRVARAAAAPAGRPRRARSGRRATTTSTRFERHLDHNGTKVVKFFLHVSKAAQKERFLARLDQPGKEWKFNAADIAERHRFDEYIGAFEDALTATSTPWAPWYVVPADQWWMTQAIVAQMLVETLLERWTCAGPRSRPRSTPRTWRRASSSRPSRANP